MENLVSLNYIDNYDVDALEEKLIQAFQDLNCSAFLKPKMKVLLKVCLPEAENPDNANTTNPAVVTAVAKVLAKKYGVNLIIADSPYKNYSQDYLDKVYFETGMLEVANLTTCTLNTDLKTCKIEVPTGVASKSVTLLNIVNEVDAIVSIGKLKLNSKFGFSGVTANLFGFVPGEMKNVVINRLKTLKDFNNYLIDIYEAVKNKLVLNVLDGIVCKENDNTQRLLSLIGASSNCFALDAAAASIFGVDLKNTIIADANVRNYSSLNTAYKPVGDAVENFKQNDFDVFDFKPEQALNKNELLRKRYYKHNQQRVKIDGGVCKGCAVCSKICPTQAITMEKDKHGELFAKIDYAKCIHCFKCATACPYSVVDMVNPSGFKHIKKQIDKYN